MKARSKDEILELNTKAQRNLSLSDLKEWYTQEELEKLGFKRYPENRSAVLADVKWGSKFEELKRQAKEATPPRLHRWTPKEDNFLLATYQYLSDKTIALALNMPAWAVQRRREVRKLTKAVNLELEVIVWAQRDRFEEDLLKEGLTKARPDIVEGLL